MVIDHYAASHHVDHLIVKDTSRVVLIDLKLNKLELPKLTNLHLELCWWPSAILSNTECFDFLAVCPNLVNLFLSHFDAWRFGILKISGPKLVNLTVNWVNSDIVEISAPKLTFLKIKGETELNFSMINLPSLKQTEVGHVVRGNRWRSNDIRMMKELCGIRRGCSLKICIIFFKGFEMQNLSRFALLLRYNQIVYNTCTLMPCFLISSLVLIVPPPSPLCYVLSKSLIKLQKLDAYLTLT